MDFYDAELRAHHEHLCAGYGINPADHVLDIGCGTGRLLLDYLAQGIDVDGVDNSPEMLARCRAKAQALGLTPRLYEQSMETLALPRAHTARSSSRPARYN
jgi:cyclopropane fatty-acyl-phospholipid synthase-like methyltransferase